MFVKLRREIGAFRPAATPAALSTALLLGLALPAPAMGGEVEQAPVAQPSDQPPAGCQDDSIVKKALKTLNLACDPNEPKDFVRAARPANPASDEYVPVFRPTSEHKAKLLTPDQLKSLESELGSAQTQGANIRDAFPPARRAYLDSEKAKAEKAEAKKNKAATPTATQ
jgi:hypothetical protein